MKKGFLLIIIGLAIFMFSSCGTKEEIDPTGYNEGVWRPCLIYNGNLYVDKYIQVERMLDGYEEVGKIIFNDDMNDPTEEFHSGRLEKGLPVYAASDKEDIYIGINGAYEIFKLEKK